VINCGKYYVHNGTAWVESTDQTTPADIVTETGALQAYPGDLNGGSEMNQTRDVLNKLTRTIGFNSNAGLNAFIGPEFGYVAGVKSSASVASERTAVSGLSQAACDTNYNAAAATVAATSNSAFCWKQEDSAAGAFRIFRKSTLFQAPHLSGWGNPPNPDGLTRELTFWVRAKKRAATSGGSSQFDAYGDEVLEDVWHQVGAAVTTNTTGAIVGNQLGTVAGNAPSPWSSGGTYQRIRGWEYQAAIITEWDVTGGFTYTSSTP
jgi:hypothetical protein